ncbi:hypothetical protein SAMN05216241_1222 [Limimonas halophila]|uniref:Uncharacterized protein n=2 Tax=Limimonas halophila TaxID=1082479 RepID=A0A1G7V6U5_9PROT|nr:hypothetical protein SAMN05216241_1222 [Limimonas halophila]
MTARTNSLLHDETTILRQVIYQKVLIRKHNSQAAPFDEGVLDALRNKKRQVALSLFNKKNEICLINIFSGSISAEYYLYLDNLHQLVKDDDALAGEIRSYVGNDKRVIIEHEDQSGQILMSYLKRVT